MHEQDKVNNAGPPQIEFHPRARLNETFGPKKAPLGIVVQGGMYNGVIRALQRLGLADHLWRTPRCRSTCST